MKLKRLLALSLGILLITTLFAGCGNTSDGAEYTAGQDVASGSAESELTDSATGTASITPQNQKLIRTLYLDAETEDMDPLLASIDAKIAELGGYAESRQVEKESLYSSVYRKASLTIRIPAENLDSFVSHMSESSNITSNRETTEDITLKYVATESRISALETEQTRLLELLAQAENMDELLTIESRLTDVRTELEQVNSLLRKYDNQVNYGTIHLELQQVEEYTETKSEPKTFWEKISTGFMTSLEGVGNFLLGLVIFLIVASPYLVIIAGIWILVHFLRKRRKKKNNPPTL